MYKKLECVSNNCLIENGHTFDFIPVFVATSVVVHSNNYRFKVIVNTTSIGSAEVMKYLFQGKF